MAEFFSMKIHYSEKQGNFFSQLDALRCCTLILYFNFLFKAKITPEVCFFIEMLSLVVVPDCEFTRFSF